MDLNLTQPVFTPIIADKTGFEIYIVSIIVFILFTVLLKKCLTTQMEEKCIGYEYNDKCIGYDYHPCEYNCQNKFFTELSTLCPKHPNLDCGVENYRTLDI